MKNTFFKRTALAIALSSSLFAMTANAALKPVESPVTNQIHGFMPIFPAMGAAITKEGSNVPYAASVNGGEKTTVKVGDTLYVPVGVAESIRADNEEALGSRIYRFADLDGDIEAPAPIALTVEWFAVPKGTLSFKDATPVQTETAAGEFGVPYKVKLGDAGKQIGFRVTPITALGLPDTGAAIEVLNVATLYGQAYPEITDPKNPGTDTDGDGKPDEPGTVDPSQPPVVIVPVDPENPGTTDPENPNIGGGGIVDSGFAKYQVAIVNAKDELMGTGATGVKAYVNSEYRAVISKIDQDPVTGEIVLTGGLPTYTELTQAETDALSNNIVWQLLDGTTVQVSTGLSDAAVSNDAQALADLLADPAFDAKATDTAKITGRLTGNNTLAFTTQANNADALYNGLPNNSEQGLTIKAILVADDELEIPAAAAASVVAE